MTTDIKNTNSLELNDNDQKGCLHLILSLVSGVLGISILLSIIFILIYLVFWAAGGILVIADPLENTDAVAALSGGNIDRVEFATELIQEKYADLLILTETGQNVPELGRSYTTLLKTEAIRLGIPNSAILFTDQPASSTYEEAQSIKQLMQRNDLRSVIVVTDAYHTFRTRLIFQEVFSDSDLKAIVRPVGGQWYRSKTWWLSPAGWQATLNEYSKIIAFMLGFKSD